MGHDSAQRLPASAVQVTGPGVRSSVSPKEARTVTSSCVRGGFGWPARTPGSEGLADDACSSSCLLVYPPAGGQDWCTEPGIFDSLPQGLDLWTPSPPVSYLASDPCFDVAVRGVCRRVSWFIAKLPTLCSHLEKTSDRIFALGRLISDRGAHFTILGSADLACWRSRPAKRLSNCPGVHCFCLDRIRVLSNADWTLDSFGPVGPAIRSWLDCFGKRGRPTAAVSPVVSPIFLRGTAIDTAREAKERTNNRCLGGLRNPNSAVARCPGLRKTGEKIRGVLESIGRVPHLRRQILDTISQLGTQSCQGFSHEIVLTARRLLHKEFRLEGAGHPRGFRFSTLEGSFDRRNGSRGPSPSVAVERLPHRYWYLCYHLLWGVS